MDFLNEHNNIDEENDEPECIKRWAASFRERISQKDENEQKMILEMEEKGMQELHDWGVHYRESLARSVKLSRAHDKELLEAKKKLEERTNYLSNTNANDKCLWESVCQLCNFVSSSENEIISNGIAPTDRQNQKDLNRMRDLLLQLKKNPPAIQPQQPKINAH